MIKFYKTSVLTEALKSMRFIDVSVNVVKTKITDEQYNKAKENFSKLNDNAKYPLEQAKDNTKKETDFERNQKEFSTVK